jgi:hypothetical protein
MSKAALSMIACDMNVKRKMQLASELSMNAICFLSSAKTYILN